MHAYLKSVEIQKLYPHTYANYCSYGEWKMYDHLSYISKTITPALLKGNARYIVEVPPRHGKSSFISVWLPLWLLETFGKHKIILASYGSDLAEYFTNLMIETIKGFQRRIGVRLSRGSASRSFFRTTSGGQVLATGIGGATIGFGANTFLIDDIHKNWEQAMSKKIRDKNKDWFKTVVSTRIEKGGNIIVLGTRWSDEDLMGWLRYRKEEEEEDEKALGRSMLGHVSKYIEDARQNFKVISIKSLCEDEDEDPLGRSMGQCICPELFDEKDLEVKRRDMGTMHFMAHFQNSPLTVSGNIIREEDIKYYDKKKMTSMKKKIIVADLSYKETSDGSYSCVECWGLGDDGNFYLIESKHERCNYLRQKNMITEMANKHTDAFDKYIEKFANGEAAIADLEKDISGLKSYAPRTSKEARLHVVSEFYHTGKVFYPRGDEYIKDTNIREILAFPFYSSDDTVDCATMALLHLGKGKDMTKFLDKVNRGALIAR